ncbi:cytochrome C oxidase Cbb3, partial [Pseudomonas aeruginosa]
HRREGKGSGVVGAPNLTKPGAFIYGSSYAQLQQTIRHGRQGQMPAQEPYRGKENVQILARYNYKHYHNQGTNRTHPPRRG